MCLLNNQLKFTNFANYKFYKTTTSSSIYKQTAMTAYKSNYMVKHKSVSMLYQFLLHLLTICGIVGGVYFSYNAQEAVQQNSSSVSHFYSLHSWTGLITIALFTFQVSVSVKPLVVSVFVT